MYLPPSFGEITHVLTLAGDPEPMNVTYGIQLDASLDDEEAADVAIGCHDSFASDIMAVIMPDAYSLQATLLRYKNLDPDEEFVAAATGAVAGVGGASFIPQNSAYLIHKRTAYAGRRGRGRFYLPGVPEVQVNGVGALVPSWATTITTQVQSLRTDVNNVVNVLGMVVLHSTSIAIPDPLDLPPPYPITGLDCDPMISTQRRRLRR